MSFSRFTKIGAGLAAAAVALSACGAAEEEDATGSVSASGATGRTAQEIQDSGKIRLGVFSDKAPFGSVDSNGDYVGYDIEYGEQIAEDLGVEPEWVPVDASARVEFLESDKVDVILANFTVTDERAEKVDFANPYMQVSLGVVSPVAEEITDTDQLADQSLIIVRGTTAESYLDANYPDADVQKYEQYTEATNALIDGRGDAWVTDNTEGLAWAQNHEDFTTGITSLGDPDTIAAAVKKGNTDLLEWLNSELTELPDDFFHGLYEETLLPVYGDQVSPDELVIENGQA
ncbi:transporter substrate-binding domain-containing protein [Ancrocorticia populi]|uniref:Amino acid ABC transporter substrate-binding protein n=2 Tax=Ancrocorticia populi TaxID=2175228 RepID=A0A2V1K4U1_9ACTO|nr:transporter substrate-binding domain-containing protein [Ancrocorticia populi]PWF26110.1 amino acid ABC transporter substrate-binding protein [Ancrocorticia populi]